LNQSLLQQSSTDLYYQQKAKQHQIQNAHNRIVAKNNFPQYSAHEIGKVLASYFKDGARNVTKDIRAN